MSEQFKVGQTVWTREAGSFVISKVGRRWVEIGLRRFDKTSMRCECTGWRVWQTREAYEAARSAEDEWRALKACFGYGGPPDGVTADDIREARRLLKIERK